MLLEAKNAAILPQHLEYIASESVKDAFIHLVGLAASDGRFQCFGELKGVVRDFRFYDAAGQQPFAFIVNRESLLFYFRAPAIRSGSYRLAELEAQFGDVTANNSGEWTVRIVDLAGAKRVWDYVSSNADFRSGDSATTRVGYINRHNQRCGGHRGRAGNDHLQRAYRMHCLQAGCGNVYGANGSDVFQRKCPKCQGGEPGIEF